MQIGIIVYTQGTETNLKRCLRSLQNLHNNLVVVSDGALQFNIKKDYPNINTVIEFSSHKYPSTCYNAGIRHLLKTDVDHIFIINDCLEILSDDIFQKYIDVSTKTNIEILCSGNNEDDPTGQNNNIRLKVDIKDNILNLNKGFNGRITYIRKSAFKKVGFFDERYHAAFELADFYKRCSDRGLTTPFGWFPDISFDEHLIEENQVLYDNKQSYNLDDIEDRMIRGMKVFYLKYKSQIADLYDLYSKIDVVNKLKLLSSRKQ